MYYLSLMRNITSIRILENYTKYLWVFAYIFGTLESSLFSLKILHSFHNYFTIVALKLTYHLAIRYLIFFTYKIILNNHQYLSYPMIYLGDVYYQRVHSSIYMYQPFWDFTGMIEIFLTFQDFISFIISLSNQITVNKVY